MKTKGTVTAPPKKSKPTGQSLRLKKKAPTSSKINTHHSPAGISNVSTTAAKIPRKRSPGSSRVGTNAGRKQLLANSASGRMESQVVLWFSALSNHKNAQMVMGDMSPRCYFLSAAKSTFYDLMKAKMLPPAASSLLRLSPNSYSCPSTPHHSPILPPCLIDSNKMLA